MMLFQLLLSGIVLLSGSVHTESLGKYSGDVDSYEIMINDTPIQVAASRVAVSLSSQMISYESEGMSLEGAYEIVKEDKKYQYISAEMTNGKSLNFGMYFKVHKKGKELIITDTDFEQDKAVLLKEDQ